MAYQESHWDSRAVSPTGVRGIMMLTKTTADIVGIVNRNDPRESIVGGAKYLARVRDKVPDRIDEPDRLWMAMAAYNIGFGHLEDARIITEIEGADPDSWEDVRQHLPLLSDEEWFRRVKRGYARGDVAVLYVDNIRRYYELLLWVMGDDSVDPESEEAVVRPDATSARNWTWTLFDAPR
jgi:membrane-bound lytic murein transglycosylase F